MAVFRLVALHGFEVVDGGGGGGGAAGGVFAEEAHDPGAEVGGEVLAFGAEVGRLVVEVGVEDLAGFGGLEGGASGEAVVEAHAEGVEIGGDAGRGAAEDFRGDVFGGDEEVGGVEGLAFGEVTGGEEGGGAEVEDFEEEAAAGFLGEHHVFGFEVAVDEGLGVDGGGALEDLAGEEVEFLEGEGAAGEVVVEVDAGDEFGDEAEAAVVLALFDEAEDVRVVDGAEGVFFVDAGLAGGEFGHAVGEEAFDGDEFAGAVVEAGPDFRHAADGDEVNRGVFAVEVGARAERFVFRGAHGHEKKINNAGWRINRMRVNFWFRRVGGGGRVGGVDEETRRLWIRVSAGREEWLEAHSRRLLASWRRWTGEALNEEAETAGEAAPVLFAWPVVVLSSRGDAAQTLEYANAAALRLWEMEWEEMERMPSEETAEPEVRAVRAAFLARVRQEGMVRDYSGVRISRRGRRFRIVGASVWSLAEGEGKEGGLAAMFARWEPVVPSRLEPGGGPG